MNILFFCYLSFGLAFALFCEDVHSVPEALEAEVTLTGVDMKQVLISYFFSVG